MMLVYSNGRYYMFFNGELMMSIHEDTTFSWSTDTVGGIVGTSGNVKVGLSVLYGAAAVVDWGYTTDAAKIAAFLGSLAKRLSIRIYILPQQAFIKTASLLFRVQTTARFSLRG